MIYDRVCSICALHTGSSPLKDRATVSGLSYYAPMQVYASRYWAAQQAGVRIDTMVQLPLPVDVGADSLLILQDEQLYRIVQLQETKDADGLPCLVLSLRREDKKYDIIGA